MSPAHTPQTAAGEVGRYETRGGEPRAVVLVPYDGGGRQRVAVVDELVDARPEDGDTDLRWVEGRGLPPAEAHALAREYLRDASSYGEPRVRAGL